MNYQLNFENIDRIERGIAPPMRHAVTVPVERDGGRTGIAVYVASSPFSDYVKPADLLDVAGRLQLANAEDETHEALIEKQIEVRVEAARRLTQLTDESTFINNIPREMRIELKEIVALLTATPVESWL